MPRYLVAILLLLPAFAFADCGFTRSGNAMTIVVGKDPKCLSSEGFREAFKADIAQALVDEEAQPAQRKGRAFDDRNARSAKLWTIAERRHQEVGGTYFGQKR